MIKLTKREYMKLLDLANRTIIMRDYLEEQESNYTDVETMLAILGNKKKREGENAGSL